MAALFLCLLMSRYDRDHLFGAYFADIRLFARVSFVKKNIANLLRLCYNKICMRYVNYIKNMTIPLAHLSPAP